MGAIRCLICDEINPSGSIACAECAYPLDVRRCKPCGALDRRDALRCFKCQSPFEALADPTVADPQVLRAAVERRRSRRKSAADGSDAVVVDGPVRGSFWTETWRFQALLTVVIVVVGGFAAETLYRRTTGTGLYGVVSGSIAPPAAAPAVAVPGRASFDDREDAAAARGPSSVVAPAAIMPATVAPALAAPAAVAPTAIPPPTPAPTAIAPQPLPAVAAPEAASASAPAPVIVSTPAVATDRVAMPRRGDDALAAPSLPRPMPDRAASAPNDALRSVLPKRFEADRTVPADRAAPAERASSGCTDAVLALGLCEPSAKGAAR